MAQDPGEIVRGEAGAGDDVVGVRGETRHREVALDAALGVQHLGVDDAAGRACDVAGADPGQHRLGILPDQQELRERAGIEQGHPLTAGAMLLAHRVKPVRPAETVDVARLVTSGPCKPIGALPAELLAEHGAGLLQALIERRAAERPSRIVLLGRPGDGVMLAVQLKRARPHPAVIAVGQAKASDVDRPQVHRRLAPGDPFGERPSGAAGRGDPESVEAAAHVHPAYLRRLAEDEIAIGRERLGSVDQLLDARALERRHPDQRLCHQLLEAIPIGIQQGEVEVLGDAGLGPWLRVRLVATHHQAADLLLEVDQPVRVA